MKFKEEYIQTNGIRLHVVTAGPRDGHPVILLHGFPEFWYGWRHQIPTLAEAGFRLIVPDQRGYNLSDKPKGVKPYRISELTADVISLLDALGYEKVNLVGHDWGAAVVWSAAIRFPARFERLGILNVPHPNVMTRFLRRSLEQLRRSWYIFAFQLPWLPEVVIRRDDWRNGVRMLRGSGKLHTFTNEDIQQYKQAWSQPGAMTGMLNWYRAALRYPPVMSKDARVRIPTLILWGRKDVALSYEMVKPSLEYCDDGKLVTFDEATHWVQHDEADAVNRRLIDFFKP